MDAAIPDRIPQTAADTTTLARDPGVIHGRQNGTGAVTNHQIGIEVAVGAARVQASQEVVADLNLL